MNVESAMLCKGGERVVCGSECWEVLASCCTSTNAFVDRSILVIANLEVEWSSTDMNIAILESGFSCVGDESLVHCLS